MLNPTAAGEPGATTPSSLGTNTNHLGGTQSRPPTQSSRIAGKVVRTGSQVAFVSAARTADAATTSTRTGARIRLRRAVMSTDLRTENVQLILPRETARGIALS